MTRVFLHRGEIDRSSVSGRDVRADYSFVAGVRVWRRHVEVEHRESPLLGLSLQHRTRVQCSAVQYSTALYSAVQCSVYRWAWWCSTPPPGCGTSRVCWSRGSTATPTSTSPWWGRPGPSPAPWRASRCRYIDLDISRYINRCRYIYRYMMGRPCCCGCRWSLPTLAGSCAWARAPRVSGARSPSPSGR